MEYISSDTNVWIDFNFIDKLELPFRLDCTYIMNIDAIEDEIRNPIGLRDRLVELGLQGVNLTFDEFVYADMLSSQYKKLSVYDITALAIAAKRKIPLLTGDKNLRKAAAEVGVEVIGTIGILDRLYEGKRIDEAEYQQCIKLLIVNNGAIIRLPQEELIKRAERFK